MKRFILLLILLTLALGGVSAQAAERGETVTVTFEIVDNEFEAISARVGFSFDPKVFEFVSAEKISSEVMNRAPEKPEGSFGLVSLTGITPGILGTVTLRIREDAPGGAYEVAPVVDSVYNADRQVVTLNVKGETVRLDHQWDLGRVTVEATCYSEGVMRYRCLYCEAARTESIPMTEHREGAPVTTKVVSCTQDGWEIFPCAICGDVLREGAIPAIGHAEGDAVITREPTAYENGVISVQCANCGKTIRTEEIPATGPARFPGDADDSGSVNILDALLTLQYAVGWDVQINADNANVNGDGAVDVLDALLILQHSVGWDVELK